MENDGFKETLSRDDHTEVIFCHSIKTIRTFLVLNKAFPLQQGVSAILSASAKMLHPSLLGFASGISPQS